MHDNAVAAKRFTLNAAQQLANKHCINFKIFGSEIFVAMQQKELGKTIKHLQVSADRRPTYSLA
jgi:hypothetical protein